MSFSDFNREWLLSILIPPEGDFPQSWSFTIVTTVNQDSVLEIISAIQLELSELLIVNQVKFVHALKLNVLEIAHFFQCLFACNVLYANGSNFELHDLWGQLYLIFLSIFQQTNSNIGLKYHEICTNPEIEQYVNIFCSLTTKICLQNGKPAEVPSLLWRMYTQILPSKSYLLLHAFHSHASSIFCSDFLLNIDDCKTISLWISNDYLSTTSIRFLVDILNSCKLDFEEIKHSASDILLMFLFFFSHFNDIESEKRSKLFSVSLRYLNDGIFDELSASEFSISLSILPKKWFGEVKSLMSINDYDPLTCCIHYLLKLIGKSSLDKLIKCTVFVDYFSNVLSFQVYSEFTRDALIVQSRSFSPDELGFILSEFHEMSEKGWSSECVTYVYKASLTILAKAPREDKVYSRLSMGLINSISRSLLPLEFLDQICRSACSPEQMALFCESAIFNYIDKAPFTSSWDKILQVLKVPELEESTFIRHCISHCLVFTLYSHSSARLKAYASNFNMKFMIGEQIGVWIESLHLDSSVSNPSKVVLMLLQFFSLMQLELNSLENVEHSRLFVHLKSIQEVLFRWSNPPSATLWSALGFSQQSSLPADFRLICRFLSSFIASRLISADHEVEYARLSDSLDAYFEQAEYSSFPIVHEMKTIFRDRLRKMNQLGEIATSICLAIFPAIAKLFIE